MKSLTKEEIKERLIRRAAETWGMDEMEIEYSFDPIVSILFDACAHEFERVSDSIKSSRTRITERLVDLLTPEVSVAAQPAHAILHAVPTEDQIDINERSLFYHRKRMPLFREHGKSDFEDFFFCPAGSFKLNDCQLRYIAYPDKIVSYKDHRPSPLFTAGDFMGNPENSCMYLGIQTGKEIAYLEQLLCYFDLLNFSQKELLTHHLGISHWTLNNEKLRIVKGYHEKNAHKDDISAYINESIQSKGKFYQNYIKEFYEDHFYTIDSKIPVAEHQKKYPENFADFLSAKSLDVFQDELIWIKISFSTVVSSQMLENLHCHINAFPVLNKRPFHINRRLQPYFNILPLDVGDDFFFDVQKVEGDSGNYYYVQDRDKNDQNKAQAYLRYGGVSRFDERDASELLNYTLDLLKEDGVAFSAINDDFINSNLKDLKQIISRIEQQIELQDFTKNKIPYLIINKNSIDKNKDETVFASYWTTAGKRANKINPYVRLHQYTGTAFVPNSIALITGTTGGKDEPAPSEKIYAYREHVLSKGRIVTRQDIIQYCYNIYKNSITKVVIERGTMVALEHGVGYTPTTDIYVHKNAAAKYDEADWDHLKKEVLIGLKAKSANVLPFRIFYV
ncbi:hypothetical protein [Spongiimicrobium salis]|uniref:hypothetical protein n=1 Tax=Spongiimicrobium salis TaxID=1667022 RepID=UPI00374D5ECA